MEIEEALPLINNDTQEPLNYTSYIYDIAMFGRDSYVMSRENAKIWDRLAQSSCYLYGHTAIHDYVYERLTDANIDRLIGASGKLGRQLNNFYSTDQFAPGGIIPVLQGMTITAFNLLDHKMRTGFARYCDTKITANDCGKWLNDTFTLNSPELAAMTSASQIAASETVTKLILANPAASVAYTCAPSAITAIGANAANVSYITTSLSKLIEQQGFVQNISENIQLVKVLCQDAQALTTLADNEQMMRVLFSSVVAFAYLATNQLAIETIFSNVVAVGVFARIYKDIVHGENALKSVKAHILGIENDIVDVVGQNAVVDDVIEIKQQINAAIETLKRVTSHADVMINNVNAITNDEATMSVIADCATAVEVITNDEAAMDAITTSVIATDAFYHSSTAFGIIKNKSMAIAKLSASLAGWSPLAYYDMAVLVEDQAAMEAIAASNVAKTEMIKQNTILQKNANKMFDTISASNKFTLVRAQKDDDSVGNANYSGATSIIFAIPGGYNSGSGVTVCKHGHNNVEAGKASGSYTSTSKRLVLLGGATFTESGDGMVRTWVYVLK